MAKSVLAVIDMQNDFIDGALGTNEAQAIVGKVATYIEHSLASGEEVVYTAQEYLISSHSVLWSLLCILRR